MLLFSVVSMLPAVFHAALQGFLPFNPQKFGAVTPGPWHSIPPLRSRPTPTGRRTPAKHDELLHADGWAGISQFRFGRRRHRAGNRLHSRHRAPGDADHRQFLGRHDARLPLGVVALLHRWRAVLGFPGSGTESEALRHGAVGRTAASADHRTPTASPPRQTVHRTDIAQGPVASQEIIKKLGTNGGGFFNANSAHPFENPTPLTNLVEMFCIFAISAGLTYTLGRMTDHHATAGRCGRRWRFCFSRA